MRVLIHGFYGAGNAGDDAILHSIIDTLREINPTVKIAVTVFSNNIRPYYGDVPLRTISGSDFKSISNELKNCSLLIVGGGGLFQDYNTFKPENLFLNQKGALNYYTAPIILAKMLNVKCMLYGVGIGPLNSQEAKGAMKWVSQIVDGITVRDTYSSNFLTSLGISKHVLAADPAIKLQSSTHSTYHQLLKKSESQINIGLNLRNWPYDKENAKKLEEEIIGVLNHYSKHKKLHYYIMPFNKLPSEIEKSKQLEYKLNGKATVIPYNMSPCEYKELCKNLDLMIAMRLHASIFSLSECIPSIGISYDEKVKQFYNELNIGEQCLLLETFDSNSLINLMNDSLNNSDKLKKKITSNMDLLLKREQLNKKTISKICEWM